MSAPTPASGSGIPGPGYYPDPSIPGYIRFWDGSAWVPGTSRPAPAGGEEPPAPPVDSGEGEGEPGVPSGAEASPGASGVPPVEETGPVFFGSAEGGAEEAAPESAPLGAGSRPSARPDETGPIFFDEDEPQDAAPAPAQEPEDAPPAHAGGPHAGGYTEPFDRPGAGAEEPQDVSARWAEEPRDAPAWPAEEPRDAAARQGEGPREDARLAWGIPAQPEPPSTEPPALSFPAELAGRAEEERQSGEEESGGPVGRDTMAIRTLGPGPRQREGGKPALDPTSTVALRALRRSGAGEQQSGPPAAPAQPPAAEPTAAEPPAVEPPAAQPAAAAYAPTEAAFPAAPDTSSAPWTQQVHELAQPETTAQASPLPAVSSPPPQQPQPPQPLPPPPQQEEQGPVIPWRPPASDPFLQSVQTTARPAGLGRRFIARLVDWLIVTGAVAAVAYPLATKANDHIQDKIDAAEDSGRTVTVWLIDGTTGPYLALVLGAFLVLGVLYEALPTAKWGRTLGKKLCGVRVLDIEAQDPPSFGAALKRWLTYSVLGLLAIGLVNVLWCAIDKPWRQCWHDKASRTYVARG